MENNLVWVDMEMTGLDPLRDQILEIATLVTDSELNILAEGPNLAVFQPEEVLRQMDEWNQTHHGQSGLLDRVRASTESVAGAERKTLEFVAAHCKPKTSPLCGNSVWQDRRFIDRLMPDLNRFFHYRIIDVSSVKELARRWYPQLPPIAKKESHLALADIRESLEELRYYRSAIFLPPSAPPAAAPAA
ncbi:MAG TPA: oligoribonuclease [Fibrobacteria bacterium]|nr:oligoribonuclease [Fibrobacteria bacterium]